MGSGIFTKSLWSVFDTAFQNGSVSGFNGPASRVVIEGGPLVLGPGVSFSTAANGPMILIGETQKKNAPSDLRTLTDVQHFDNQKIDPASTGVFAIKGTNNAISGLAGSVYLGSSETRFRSNLLGVHITIAGSQ